MSDGACGLPARGFTLLELLITVVVGAILLGIAMPSFRSYVQTSRLTTESESLVYSLNLARDEAVKLDTTVDVCASSDMATCSSDDWKTGWIVCYPDANCTGGMPTVLQVMPAVSSPNTVDEEVSGASVVRFNSSGQSVDSAGDSGQAFQFVFCDSRGVNYAQDIEVNLIGRIEAAQTAGMSVAGGALGGC